MEQAPRMAVSLDEGKHSSGSSEPSSDWSGRHPRNGAEVFRWNRSGQGKHSSGEALTGKGNGADYNSEKSTVSLRQYVERLISESDKRNESQFQAAKEAVAAALAAAEKAVAAALVAQDKLASEKAQAAKEALAEAQVQLTLYKAQSNEWRNTLNDLISKLMLRPEITGLFTIVERAHEELKKRVGTLEGLGQRSIGQAEAQESGSAQNKWTFQQVVLVVGMLAGWGITILLYLLKKP
jgi:dGTP triphosphohydrolase